LYTGLLVAAFAIVVVVAITGRAGALAGFAALPLAALPVRRVLGGAKGRDLIAVLGETGRLQLVVGVLVTLGVAFSA
jgi:1,4-dihydroxy-2-naphthoate octaprenyltransferase